MQLSPGTRAPTIILPSIDKALYNTSILEGQPFMISFFRFASCPFCNLRVHQLVQRYEEFHNNFSIVAIFDSPIDNLMRYTVKHQAPFPILADNDNEYYRLYGIERSIVGVGKGILFRMPAMLKGMIKGYLPTSLKGSLLTMPADFLVDQDGIIQYAHYGSDEGDHLDINQVKEFSFSKI